MPKGITQRFSIQNPSELLQWGNRLPLALIGVHAVFSSITITRNSADQTINLQSPTSSPPSFDTDGFIFNQNTVVIPPERDGWYLFYVRSDTMVNDVNTTTHTPDHGWIRTYINGSLYNTTRIYATTQAGSGLTYTSPHEEIFIRKMVAGTTVQWRAATGGAAGTDVYGAGWGSCSMFQIGFEP